MQVVIAIDSFKGSLTSMEAAQAIKEGILAVKEANVTIIPLADGGEGTTEALKLAYHADDQTVQVTGPLFAKVSATYATNGTLAIIEMAQAAGIALLKQDELDPVHATTWGVGEMIADAILKGCRKFIIGIGGSATIDGGIGMLSALGYEFLDKNDRLVEPSLLGLSQIIKIRADKVMAELKECQFTVACDVKNKLLGNNGTVHVYGPQKGVLEEEKDQFDKWMEKYAELTYQFTGKNAREVEGSGAAGGLGFAFLSYLNAQLSSGISVVLEANQFEDIIRHADIVITGEGRLDDQTQFGKVPFGVAQLAKKQNKKVIAFAGSVTPAARILHEAGIDAYFSIIREIISLQEALIPSVAKENLKLTAEEVFRLL